MSVVTIFFIAVFAGVLLLKGYFLVANKFEIFDVPNSRSSHTYTPVRGAGIIFPLAMIAGFIVAESAVPLWFITALVILSLASFWDDMKGVSAAIRFSVHIVAASLMVYQIGGGPSVGFAIIIVFATVVFINGFNFMDGINGITGFYSIVSIVTLLAADFFVARIIDPVILILALTGVLAFGIFNFRKRAVCFSGDIGSVTMALFIMYLLVLLTLSSGAYYYFVFVSVYVIDFGMTILHRILLKEKIWKPHRKHLYQLLANEKGYPHLRIAGIYGLVQLFVNMVILVVIYNSTSLLTPYIFAGFLLIAMIVVYLILRKRYFCLHQELIEGQL